jgi:hypothetical protein
MRYFIIEAFSAFADYAAAPFFADASALPPCRRHAAAFTVAFTLAFAGLHAA